MKCVLMHKRIPVAEVEIDEESGKIRRTGTVFHTEHLPVGVPVRNGIPDQRMLDTVQYCLAFLIL